MIALTDILQTVRELIFDRFIIPGIAIKAIPGHTITISSTLFKITRVSDSVVIYSGDLTVLTTFDLLAADLLSHSVVFAYTSAYNGLELTSNLLPVNAVAIDTDYVAYKRYFFSDQTIYNEIKYYYYSVLRIPVDATALSIGVWIPKLVYPSERHLALKVAYKLIDKRRLYELASNHIDSNFSDGSSYIAASAPQDSTTNISVQIGSVFSINEDPHNGELYADFNRVGSDNVLGDKYSFWYKLQLYIRGKLEEEFNDYSLRPDTIMVGNVHLENDINWRAYFDSYPFTITPLSRDIIGYNT